MDVKPHVFFIALVANSLAFADPADLTYHYTVPYSGGSSLTLTNNGNEAVTLASLSFSSNASISGTPWGTLWGWESTIKTLANADGIHTDYVITEKPNITIQPSQSVVLTYNIDAKKLGGPFTPNNAAMDSINVAVTPANSSAAFRLKVTGSCQEAACNDPGAGKEILGYYPNWAYWRNPKFTAEQLQYSKLNRIAYAFSIFDKDGKISLYDIDSDAYNLPIIAQERKKYPYLNASLSFGGWSWASKPAGWLCQTGASPQGPAACFSALAADPNATDRFVANAVKGMKEVHFNGIDIDWEYPVSSSDIAHFVTLLQKLRIALDDQGRKDDVHYFLSIAVAAGIDKIDKISAEQWQTIADTVDHIGVMTYDFHGSWDQGQTGSNFMAAMALDPNSDPSSQNPVLKHYNVIDALKAYTDRGVSAQKLVVGIPIYGRMVSIANEGTHQGLYQTITGTPQGEWDNQQSGFTGMLDYACIVDKTMCGNNYQRPDLTLVSPTADNEGKYAMTPWGYATQLFVTYDDAAAAAYKALWVLDNQFAGVMLWDLTGDFPVDDERSIINAIGKIFNPQ